MKKILLTLMLGLFLISLTSAYVIDNFADNLVNQTLWKNATNLATGNYISESGNQLRIDSNINQAGSIWIWSVLPYREFITNMSFTTTRFFSCTGCTFSSQWLFYNTSAIVYTTTAGSPLTDNIGITRIGKSNTFTVTNSTAQLSNITPTGESFYFDVQASGGTINARNAYVSVINYDTFKVWNNLTFPNNNSFVTSVTNFTVNNTGILDYNLTNSTYYIYYENGTLFNQTTKSITGKYNNTGLTYNFTIPSDYKWSINTCGTNGTNHACYSSNSNYSFSYGFIENSILYNLTTIETSEESFSLNVSLLSSISLSSAIFYYNNTAYPSTKTISGSDVIFDNTIDVPTVNSATPKEFYWTLNFDGLLVNSSINSQTVNPLNLGYCNATNTVKVMNFTSYLETNLTRVNPFAFSGTFEYYIGSGSTIKTQSIQNLSAAEQMICVSDISKDINLDAEIDYGFEDTNLTLTSRKYFFQDATITNSNQNISLLLLDSEDATTFILKVQDSSLQPVEGALIYIQRYYPGENVYRTVQVSKTDSNGRTVGFYQTETVTYKHIITKDGVVLLDTGTGGVVVGESVPFTLTFTVGDSLTPPWEFLNENSTIQTSLYYNKTTELVVFSYIDPTGSSNFGRLYVYEASLENSTINDICDTSTTGSSGTITCNMSGQSGNFVAKGYVITSTNLQKIINFIIDTARDVFDKTGAFLGWLIILTASMAFLWNPSVAIIVIDVAIVFVGIIGLLVFSPVAYFSIIGVSIILLILFKT